MPARLGFAWYKGKVHRESQPAGAKSEFKYLRVSVFHCYFFSLLALDLTALFNSLNSPVPGLFFWRVGSEPASRLSLLICGTWHLRRFHNVCLFTRQSRAAGLAIRSHDVLGPCATRSKYFRSQVRRIRSVVFAKVHALSVSREKLSNGRGLDAAANTSKDTASWQRGIGTCKKPGLGVQAGEGQ